MSTEVFLLILMIGGLLAGMLGALTGLGGGIIIVPLLTLGMGFDIKYAVGTALVTSIATSSGSAIGYIKKGLTNIRIGLFLEVATTIGAVIGAYIAGYLPANILFLILGILLIFSAIMTIRKKDTDINTETSPLAERLKLNGSFPDEKGNTIEYKVKNVGQGFSLMGIAGIFSGILGVGSGSLKVLAMDSLMKIPFKVSTTTSNFMIGVTAAASAVVYFQRGQIDPVLSAPVVVGVLIGAFIGSKLLLKINVTTLRKIFSIIIILIAIQMIYRGITPTLEAWFPNITFPKI